MPLLGCRVLVVEDEPLISEFMCETITAANGKVVGPFRAVTDALEWFDALDGVDVAVLDIGLAGETTYPLAQALQLTKIPFLFATGRGRDDLPTQFSRASYLQKPFTGASLIAAVGRCFTGRH